MLVDIACIVKIESQSPNRNMESQDPNRKMASQNPNRKMESQNPNRKMASQNPNRKIEYQTPNRKMESKDQSRKKESQNQVHLYESTPIYCLKRHSYNEALDYFLSAETRTNTLLPQQRKYIGAQKWYPPLLLLINHYIVRTNARKKDFVYACLYISTNNSYLNFRITPHNVTRCNRFHFLC